jgi:tetratricopeptide (TPR) repeat protein
MMATGRALRMMATVAVTLLLLLAPRLAQAQAGIGALDTEHSPPKGVGMVLGGNAIRGGVGTPDGFRESTPEVVGMPPPSDDPQIEYANGFTDLGFGCYLQAEEDFRRATAADPKFAKAWFMLGVARNGTGNFRGAAAAFERALKLKPDMVDARREDAVALAILGQTDLAKVKLASLQAQSAACAGSCADAELLKTSLTRVQAALSGEVTKATMNVASPAVCTVLTTKAARDCFIAAKFGDPHGNGAGDCTTAMASGLPKEITGRILVDRGVIYLAHKSNDLALKDFDKAIAADATIGDAFTNRGAAKLALKQYDTARADIDQGLTLGSSEPQKAYYNRGAIDEHLGERDAAYLDYLKASKLDPAWPAPMRELIRFSVAAE